MVGIVTLSDQWAAVTKMSKNFYKLVTIPRSYWPLLVCILNLSKALVLVLCRCLLSCSLSVTFKSTCTLFTSFSSSPCLCCYYLNFRCSGSKYLCATLFSVLVVFCHFELATCMLFTSFPSSCPFCCSSGVRLSMCNKTTTCFFHRACPLCSIWTDGHTDKWTQSDELPLNKQMWGSLTLAPNNITVVSRKRAHTSTRCLAHTRYHALFVALNSTEYW